MNLHSFRVKNFRRLKDVHIELEHDISIFVGANNSGKTSATHAIRIFMACSKDKFSIHDFSADCWTTLNALGDGDDVEPGSFPTISLDLWFNVGFTDLHRVIDLLPSLAWAGTIVGLRIEFGPSHVESLLARFREEKSRAAKNAQYSDGGQLLYHPWPKTFTEYLTRRLHQEFELRYYVLDRAQFDLNFRENPGYAPLQLTPDKGRGGAQIVNSLLKVDCLDAQRHLSDGGSGGRAEDLSRCLSRFYSRNLEQNEDDYTALRTLAVSEEQLNAHLAKVFAPTLRQLSNLGYPGLSNPRLVIQSALNPAAIMGSHDGARVYYAMGNSPEEATDFKLPDRYNGLGFKNLIYMVVELLDLHAQWMKKEEDRPPLHLIFIEEPEAHLHAQLQQAFIREIFRLLLVDGDDAAHYTSQLVITTHSPHILYERGFRPIRYFRRASVADAPTSEVLNLSTFYAATEESTRDFLERYMKLTHCDLFFADAAILVEGNVERLLMPLMIAKSAERLRSSYLSILEIGGTFSYRFKKLIEYLGISALIVTDIDSVMPRAPKGDIEESGGGEAVQDEEPGEAGVACPVNKPGAVTSNHTLIHWLPRKSVIEELLAAKDAERTQEPTATSRARVRVVYQTRQSTTWSGVTMQLAGQTLEEAFALENLEWCQHRNRTSLGLRIIGSDTMTLEVLSDRLYKRVKAKGFKKTDFALGLLAEPPVDWAVPRYIAEGLSWLADQIMAVEQDPIAQDPIALNAPVAPLGSGPTSGYSNRTRSPMAGKGISDTETGSGVGNGFLEHIVQVPAEMTEPVE